MSWVSTYEVAKTVWNAGYIATMNFTYVTEKQFVPYKSVFGRVRCTNTEQVSASLAEMWLEWVLVACGAKQNAI